MTDNDIQTEAATYTLTRRAYIIERLMQMKQMSTLIYVKPTSGAGDGFMTTIVKILPDKNLLAVDVSTDAQLNLALETSGELLFTATVNGVAAHFKVPELNPATLDGNAVFALPIPGSLYWRQRRHTYRMPIPPATPVTCIIQLTDSNARQFSVLNVSLTGILVLDENKLVASTAEVGQVFHGCRFRGIPEIEDSFTLELRRISEEAPHGTALDAMLGFHFLNTTFDFDKQIQDLLHEFAREQKRKRELTRNLPGHDA